jgi:hypothetical protein
MLWVALPALADYTYTYPNEVSDDLFYFHMQFDRVGYICDFRYLTRNINRLVSLGHLALLALHPLLATAGTGTGTEPLSTTVSSHSK